MTSGHPTHEQHDESFKRSFIQSPASEQLKQINQVRLIAVRYQCITKTTALEEKQVGNPGANVGKKLKVIIRRPVDTRF